MADLKQDLINKIKNDKYYEEMELIRLAQEPSMNYKEKVELMGNNLREIALMNTQLELIEVYFQEPEQQPNAEQAPVNAPVEQPPQQQNVHNGQSHGE